MNPNTPPSQRCFGPYATTPARVSWNAPAYVRSCLNPSHGRHFVDTRTGVVLTCDGVLLNHRVPGPSHIKMCQEHGHIVNANTLEVVG
jgi:hypothetical protein